MKMTQWALRPALAIAATLAMVGPSHAGIVIENENNNTLATAQNIDGAFTSNFDADIGDVSGANTSTVFPHVTVLGQPLTAASSTDIYSFFVSSAGITGIFDIDDGLVRRDGLPGFDAYLTLRDSLGSILAANDDFNTLAGALGSGHPFDSFIQYTFSGSGNYFIEVGQCCANQLINQGSGYALQVSIARHAVGSVPEPATWGLMIAGFGLIGAALRRRAGLSGPALA
jgi:hypothetical protein